MKYKTYRICLLSLVVLALIGGIFYYQSVKENETKSVEGTFVIKFPIEQESYYMKAFGGDYGNR